MKISTTVMTRTIEHSRKHGPFDPRWPTLRSPTGTEQLEEARLGAIMQTAVQAWEWEGGAQRNLRESGVLTRVVGDREPFAAKA
jgi:hypothetical protein